MTNQLDIHTQSGFLIKCLLPWTFHMDHSLYVDSVKRFREVSPASLNCRNFDDLISHFCRRQVAVVEVEVEEVGAPCHLAVRCYAR